LASEAGIDMDGRSLDEVDSNTDIDSGSPETNGDPARSKLDIL
jgi:hypothetical protein